MQLPHQDKQTQRLPYDSSSAAWARAEILHPIPSAVQALNSQTAAQKQEAMNWRSAAQAGKGGSSLPPALTNDLMPRFWMLDHSRRMILTAICETTLNLLRTQD